MRLSWLAALCLFIPTPASARPYTVDDLLALEAYGQVIAAPDGGWAAIDRYRHYDAGSDYTFDAFTNRTLGQVMRIDLEHPGPLEPMFPQDPRGGYWLGRLSPSGTRLTVFRLLDHRLSLGIVDVASRQVSWLADTPATPLLNPKPLWLDDERLLLVAAPDGELSFPLDSGNRLQAQLPEKWRQTAGGEQAGVSVVSSTGAETTRSTGNGFRLLLVDLRSNQRQTLDQGRIVDIALSADRQFVAITHETTPVAPRPDRLIHPSDLSWHHAIRTVRLAGGAAQDVCTGCDTLPNLLAWSPEGHRLLYYRRAPGADWSAGTLQVHEPDRAASRPVAITAPPLLPEDDSSARILRAGWLGPSPVLLARSDSGPPRWVAERSADTAQRMLAALPCQPPTLMPAGGDLLALCGDQLWRVDRQGRRFLLADAPALGLAQGWSESFDIGVRARFDPLPAITRPIIWSQAANDARTLPIDQVPAVRLPRHSQRLVDGGRGTLIAIDQRPSGASALWLIRPGGTAVQIDRINAHLEQIDEPRPVRLAGPQPRTSDWLILPPASARSQGRKLPLIVIPYPGAVFGDQPPAMLDPSRMTPVTNIQILTGLGYAVLLPSLPSTRAEGEPAAGLGAAIIAAADQAIATGAIDAGRLVVYGHSFGGFTALAAATQSDRFAAVIGSAGVYDLRLSHGTLMPYDRIGLGDGFPLGPGFGWAEAGQGHIGGAPWQQAERYRRNSPIAVIDRATAPVLLIHGDVDPVPVANAEYAYAELLRQNKDATLIRYWGEGHNIRSPANIRDMWQRIAAWLDKRLQSPPSIKPNAAPTVQARPAG